MSERSSLIEWIRGEIVGPSQPITQTALIEFKDREFSDSVALRAGPLTWRPSPEQPLQEVLYFERETPHRKYGAGALHPCGAPGTAPDQQAANATDTLGVEPEPGDMEESSEEEEAAEPVTGDQGELTDPSDEFEVTSPDVRHPSTLGLSFCVRLPKDARLVIALPQMRRFHWQNADTPEFQVNGRYERCVRKYVDDKGVPREAPVWRRVPAVAPNARVKFRVEDFVSGKAIRSNVEMPQGSPLFLRVEIYPRELKDPDSWLVTTVLRNTTQPKQGREPRESILYQAYFEVVAEGGHIQRYPESQRPFSALDDDEQSLTLLYRDSSTWGIGHGCAAGWDAEPGTTPESLYADVIPAVETPSMTPEIQDSDGKSIRLSMRDLSTLPEDGSGAPWKSLTKLSDEYKKWIADRRVEAEGLPEHLKPVASRHLDAGESCSNRIANGIALLKSDEQVRKAFKLANLAMLLQQIATKQLKKRPLQFDSVSQKISPAGNYDSPWGIFSRSEERDGLGYWRAFQIAFLLMSLEGSSRERSSDREIVDLIWFPTGGGKTEAYLAVMAFFIFHQRLLGAQEQGVPGRDGTNVLMRYTLRMLTTQQFQRAASLISAMEFLRRNPDKHKLSAIHGGRFSLGLWIGSNASPNKIAQARTEVNAFRLERESGNPLVLTECPWCRAEIGRYEGSRPRSIPQNSWRSLCIQGINNHSTEGPLLLCPDSKCAFGDEQWQNWLPIEVIDERIYKNPPSLVIATADKFAMVAYRPESGSLFGREVVNGSVRYVHVPPGLIIQDELHLISGPLGTMYGLYEGIFERLCSRRLNDKYIKPKLIASTATIRGAGEQVAALYARAQTRLFPSPGLLMSDSFFGKYARENGKLLPGRLYLGVHGNDYGSILTTQVRAFSSALFRPQAFDDNQRDAWWSLLVFYNSIRELSGAKTLFDSDIRSRLKFIFNRENVSPSERRNLKIVEELTSRLSQAEIVEMMDRMSVSYSAGSNQAFDVCLASNIIEVGVDIDRLSLMGVVGQPKTTAQYIQVTGRVGRRWRERPGLILTIYNPSKSRDRSHFEQFHSYHRRLYERVEPTSATPFALSAIKRAMPGALIAWARQHTDAAVQNFTEYESALQSGCQLLRDRCVAVQLPEDQARSLQEMERVRQELETKWQQRPQDWEEFPPSTTGEYLMLWPGQFATIVQKQRGTFVASSMRQVDGSAELTITQGY